VTSFLSQHPGGELAILTFAGKDATAEFDMIHPPDVVEKYAPDSVIGALGGAAADDDSDDDDEDDDDEDDDDEEEEVGGGGDGYSAEEVAKHVTKTDCWVILNGKVLDVTSFLSQHPGGELAILTFAGKDATAEFDMIHPPDVVEKYAPDSVIGNVGGGGGGGKKKVKKSGGGSGGGGGGLTADEVAKHVTKEDCWVILHDKVLDVTSFLSEHPGGELAILTFAGKDATAEFDMIHPPDVIEKYAPNSVIGALGSGGGGSGGGKKKKAKKGKKAVVLDKGDRIANEHAWGHIEGKDNWKEGVMHENPGVFLINVRAYFYAAWYLLSAVLYEVCATIFFNNNFKITGDRKGLTRSAILLVLFIVIHAVGNLHVFKGPDDFNGYGYFYVRLYWTGFGLPANIVEEYILLSVLLHVLAGLKRTWDISIGRFKSGETKALNLAVTGLILLTFMTIHLFQFRFGDTDQFGPYMLRPPPYLINFWGVFELNLFWTADKAIEPVGVRDIYALEFKVFESPLLCLFYVACVCVFMVHGCLGWQKLVATPSFGIPTKHQPKVNLYGYIIFVGIGLVYISFVAYCVLTAPFAGYETALQQPGHSER